ncbi:MAG TPA: D-alanine--D-alanine ligase, partial [Bacteroidales bacterium]|nr:D-alanine--D-alanine ligase [Bacteroidales bacterium]
MTTIAIMAGGNSSERKISLKTAQQILESIDKSRFTPVIVDVKGTRWMAIVDGEKYPIDKNTFSFQRKNRRIRFRFAWIAIHGTPGENGMLQGYLDCLNIPYSSCSTLVSALTFDKHMCKMYLQH